MDKPRFCDNLNRFQEGLLAIHIAYATDLEGKAGPQLRKMTAQLELYCKRLPLSSDVGSAPSFDISTCRVTRLRKGVQLQCTVYLKLSVWKAACNGAA